MGQADLPAELWRAIRQDAKAYGDAKKPAETDLKGERQEKLTEIIKDYRASETCSQKEGEGVVNNPADIQPAEPVTTAIFQPAPEQKKRFTANTLENTINNASQPSTADGLNEPHLPQTKIGQFLLEDDKDNAPLRVVAESFSPQQIAQFNHFILMYQDQRAAFLEKPTSHLRQEFLYLRVNTISRQPKLMRYIKQEYPKMDKNIHELLDEQQREKKQDSGISVEQEARFNTIIQRYKDLRHGHLINPYSVTKERVSAYTQDMSSHPVLMSYIQEHFPKMNKNIRSLSQTIDFDLSQDIDR